MPALRERARSHLSDLNSACPQAPRTIGMDGRGVGGRDGFASKSYAAKDQCGAEHADQVFHLRPPYKNDGTVYSGVSFNPYRQEGKLVHGQPIKVGVYWRLCSLALGAGKARKTVYRQSL